MYLYTSNVKNRKQARGACGGMFPLAPASTTEDGVDLSEIGYWRKNYRLQEFLFEEVIDTKGGDDNLVKFLLTEDDCRKVVKFAEGEQRYIEETGDDNDGWYDVDDFKYTAKVFRKAIKQIQEGHDIYYECWY